MRNRRNYYRLLHVQPDAPAEVIKSSYRALMLSLEMHPDRGGDPWSAALLNEAYAVLSDPAKRREYDRGRASTPRRSSPLREQPDSACVFCGDAVTAPSARCGTCQSPLLEPASLQNELSGQRLEARIAHDRDLRYFTDWPQADGFPGRVQDLSANGLRFVARRALQPYQIVKIDAGPLQATARVVHCRKQETVRTFPFVVGVEFFTFLLENHTGSLLSTRA